MIDVRQDAWRHVRRAFLLGRETGLIDERLRAHSDRFLDLTAHRISRVDPYHRSDGRRRVARIAKQVRIRQRDRGVQKAVMDPSIDVHPLYRAARLAGIEERAVDNVLYRLIECGVRAHVRRILAAQLEARADEPTRRRALYRLPAGH